MWHITEDDLESIAIGAGILGTGGGGNPYLGKLRMRQHVRAGHTARVVAPARVPDGACVASVFGMGAPTVSHERLPQGEEELRALRALEAHVGRRMDLVVPGEIGGSNSIAPLVVGAQTGLPVIDADGMGRAFPELQMESFPINGIPITPLALSSHKGEIEILRDIEDPREVERVARRWAVAHGGRAGCAGMVMTGAQLKAFCIPGTLTLVRRVGDAVRAARRARSDSHAAVLGVTGGCRLFEGKVVDLVRRTTAGFARGEMVLAGKDGARCVIAFQNENLIARRTLDGTERVLAIVPDLICVTDSESGEPITTELLRYGLRVTVLGIPAPPQLRTPRALEFVGPAAFGYDLPYVPLVEA